MTRAPSVGSGGIRREHPWERARRLAFSRWEAELRRVPYDHPLPDVAGFAHSIEPPLHWGDSATLRRFFALSALPTGFGPTYLAAVPTRQRPPTEGALVRLPRPIKRVLPTPDSAFGELLIEARRGLASATWEEILPGFSPHSAATVVPQLAELWQLPEFAVESLLLPIVGSIPWHGRPAGLDWHIEVEGWSLSRHRSLLAGLLTLTPDWVAASGRRPTATSAPLELVSGARVQRASPAAARPFSVQIRPASAPPAPSLGPEAASRSVITYGPALGSEFAALLSAGHGALLLTREETSRVPRAGREIPDGLRAAVWGLHWWTPEPPDAPDWHRWLRDEEPRLREALGALPGAPTGIGPEPWSRLVDLREFRDRMVQTAIARARLRGATEVEAEDLRWVVGAWARVTERAKTWAREGRGPLARDQDRTAGGRTTRLRRSLEALFSASPGGLSLEEAIRGVRTGGSNASPWEVENQLERLRIRGLLFQDRTGRYRVA